MAEAKKDDKKSGGGKGDGFGFEEVFLLVLAMITIFFVLIPRFSESPTDSSQETSQTVPINNQIKDIYDKVFNEQQIDENTKEPSLLDQTKFRVTDTVTNIFYGIIILAIFFTILFLILKNYFAFKLKIISEEYNKTIGVTKIETADDAPDTREVPSGYIPDTNGITNPTWNMIQSYAQSGNPAELRLAIIEADIMLFDVLKKSGFDGDHIGDVLKNINKSQLANIDSAWRAHKVRNELAHQGSNYVLSRTAAENALGEYKKVFDDLGLI